ncbi:hypothetical protein Mapa_000556 [Marchantia paleacea]|nr:hypothetical protein Mapa_000556 [Marchantia paleacea]
MPLFYVGVERVLKGKAPCFPDHGSVFDPRCAIPSNLHLLRMPKERIPFDWYEDHIHDYSQPMVHVQIESFHQYKHRGRPYFIRIQRCKADPENGLVYWVDYRGHRLPMRQNTYMRNDTTRMRVEHGNNCFRITPYSSYTMLINGTIPALRIIRSPFLDFSMIELAPQVEGRLMYKAFTKRSVGGGRASIAH